MESSRNSDSNLDGITILRFTHAFDSGGGVELYLRDLNNTLLNRNNMTILQVHFSNGVLKPKETIHEKGRGKLVHIAIPPAIHPSLEWRGTAPMTNSFIKMSKKLIRDHILYNPGLKYLFMPFKKHYRKKALGIETRDARRLFNDLLSRYSINLISLHCLGGADTAELIEMATSGGIPFFYLNHYSNDKLSDLCIREQLTLANAVAGVSAIGVPGYLQKRYISLYDGINTDFYNRENVVLTSAYPDEPILLLPARICSGKGHEDLIEAAARLKKEGVAAHIVFAGRNDSPEITARLQEKIKKHGLQEKITFAGQCKTEKLREWYARSAVVVLPSRSEGFARVLLEAQAMKTPVVAYDVGGISQCVIHGESGYLCKYKDLNNFTTVLKKLLRSEPLRRGMGEAGRKFVAEKFTLDHLACRHEKFYLSIIKNCFSNTQCDSLVK
ncbi:MAG: glycosyltransferase family 4 protein [Chitinispirillaceae bacterium]